jgi:hypothetical protein
MAAWLPALLPTRSPDFISFIHLEEKQRTFSLPFFDPRRHGQKSRLHVDGFFRTRFKEWNANLVSISLQKFALPIQITNFTMHIRRLNKLLMIATIKYLEYLG